MALASAVAGARHTVQTITWTQDGTTPQNLTGATVTGLLRNIATGVVRAIDGTLTVTGATTGVFTWNYGALDVGTVGR